MFRVIKFSLFLWFFLLLTVALTGCSVLSPKVGPYVAKAVARYCAEPEASRKLLRAEVNGLVAPNAVHVTCQGDVSP